MRLYTLALFIFAFNLVIGVLNGAVENVNIQDYTGWTTKVSNMVNETYLGDSAAPLSSGQEFGDVIKTGGYMIQVLGYAVVAPGHYLHEFGMHSSLELIITMMMYLIYGVAIIQFFSNRSFKSNE